MFLWLIGLATSLSLLFQDMGQGAFLVTLPLWCLGIFFMVYYVRFSEINVDLLWFGTLMSALLISLNQISEDLLPNAATLILLHVVIGGALFVYAIRINVACDDVVDRRPYNTTHSIKSEDIETPFANIVNKVIPKGVLFALNQRKALTMVVFRVRDLRTDESVEVTAPAHSCWSTIANEIGKSRPLPSKYAVYIVITGEVGELFDSRRPDTFGDLKEAIEKIPMKERQQIVKEVSNENPNLSSVEVAQGALVRLVGYALRMLKNPMTYILLASMILMCSIWFGILTQDPVDLAKENLNPSWTYNMFVLDVEITCSRFSQVTLKSVFIVEYLERGVHTK
jgi:hypothetical protein